jgi:hypothetical protein
VSISLTEFLISVSSHQPSLQPRYYDEYHTSHALRSPLYVAIVGLSTFLGVTALPLRAADGTYDNLEVLQGLTLRQHAVMEGGLTLRNPAAGTGPDGSITEESALKIETIYNASSTGSYFVGEVVPAHDEHQTVWNNVWGNIDTTEWVETWGWVTREVQVPVYGDITTTHYTTTEATYDEFGNGELPDHRVRCHRLQHRLPAVLGGDGW